MHHDAGWAAGANPARQGVIGKGLNIFRITCCNAVAGWLAMSRGKWRGGKLTLLPGSGKLFDLPVP
jgi:hypothetical protein